MTLFTDGLIVRRDRNLLDDVATGQLDAAEAAFDQAWFENPTTAVRRISELNEAEQGEVIRPAMTARGYTSPAVRAEPDSPMLTAEEARARVKESGLDLSIDDSGIREGALDILIERKRAETQRKFLLSNAPSSTVPLQLLAGFAASAADPINIASAFVPVVGEARMASLLARAGTSVAGRAVARAQAGAIEGAAGAALVEPLILAASAQDQADYDITDSLLNVAFGTVLGGGLHSVGGAVSDWRRRGVLDSAKAEVPQAQAGVTDPSGLRVDAQPAPKMTLAEAIARGDDDPIAALRVSLERGIADDQANIREVAGRQAGEELAEAFRAELGEIAAGRLPNVRDLRAEQAQLDRQASGLDATFKERAKAFQGQRMSRKQAERAARDAIATERDAITARQQEIAESLDTNRQAEAARADLAKLRRGEIPERFAPRIEARAQEIASGFSLSASARLRAESAPWQIRQAALRAAVAQAVSGKPVDVEAVFDLADPALRPKALDRLRQPTQRPVDAESDAISRSADEALALPDSTDLEGAEKLLADELALTDEMARQAGLDVAPFFKEADELMADAETFAAAYRAAALCQLRT
ncbi:hypothetical protein JQR85_13510 [Stutzerimonas urumqiensis]|uniref:hypothetical protein n=1 Tax=Stutzerimonas urumqiensis TaxID=638269 RepID=UPI003DA5724C